MNRLSIIVTTCGRPSLEATLRSIRDQYDGEEIIVAAEGDVDVAREIFDAVDPRYVVNGRPAWMLWESGPYFRGFWGHNLANHALSHLATGSHVCRIDDDDVYLPDALDAMADAVAAFVPVAVYRARWGAGHPANGVTLWRQEGLVAKGEVATPMVVWRRLLGARFGLDYAGDYGLYCELADAVPVADWVWDERVTVEVRPVAVDDLATPGEAA